MAYQTVQTPVTLNDLEGHFSYLTLLTHLLGNMIRIKFDRPMCTRIGEHSWSMTLSEHSSVFQMQVATCAAIYKISTGTPASCSPSSTAGLLVYFLVTEKISEDVASLVHM